MSFRRFATGAALAIAGLAAAVGIGLLANSISGDSVGLGAEPLSAGETLAPATDDSGSRQRRNRNRGGDDRPADTAEIPTGTGPTTTTFDEHRGGDSSGGDSSGDGSGSNSGSGSSGSGRGDDSPEFEDD